MHDWHPCSGKPFDGVAPDEASALLEHLLADSPCEHHSREIGRLGLIVDLSGELNRGDGVELALKQGRARLTDETLEAADAAVLHYCMSNAWEIRRRLERMDWDIHAWEQPELEQQIVHLRHAVRLGQTAEVDRTRLCQIYTNLGNLLNHCGRIVEAMTSWDEALSLDPLFMMALGNRGYGLFSYSQMSHDRGHKVLFLQAAHRGVNSALGVNDPSGYDEARKTFEWVRDQIESHVPQEVLSRPFKFKPRRKWSVKERVYREWVLSNRLFLNDLNDLDLGPVAAADVLTLPAITTSLEASQPSTLGVNDRLMLPR